MKDALRAVARRWRRYLLLALLVTPPLAYRVITPIHFNQHLIERLELRHDPGRWSNWSTLVNSGYRAGLDLIRRPPRWHEPALSDSLEVLEYILSWVPGRATAYPTEGYYYFHTELEGKLVRGSFRLADLPLGRLTFSYFTAGERAHVIELDSNDGVEVSIIEEKKFRLAFRNRSAEFRLSTIGALPPKAFRLLEDEVFVARVFDESGMRFFLLMNETTNSFYYVLDEEDRIGDTLKDVGDNLRYGERTRFLFYEDPDYGRRLLVGIGLEHAEANDYFDGPGDQVPYDLNVRELLHRVYPSTLLGSGVDPHGVWLDKPEWVRFAISPYFRYGKITEVAERVPHCLDQPNKSELWTCLTKEWWYSGPWIAWVEERLTEEGKTRPDFSLRVH